MTTRVFNFSAGPATLPLEVLEQAAQEISSWNGIGMGIMEISHRGKEFTSIYQQAQQDLRELLAIPENYHILFMSGGATAQAAVVPFNIAQEKKISFALTGIWSRKFFNEAKCFNPTEVVLDIDPKIGQDIPELTSWQIDPNSAYLHICSNETIEGLEFQSLPNLSAIGINIPLVVDCSSNIASRPIDWSNVGIAFAGAQKNIGPAGVTIVIVREDLLDKTRQICPSVFNYRKVADNQSMLNTPPTWSIYVSGLVFKWLLKQGGVEAIEQKNIAKANLLYDYIDSSELYSNNVAKASRSRMNVPFLLADESLNSVFLEQALKANLSGLKGHKSVGGMRASIYNAMPIEGVQALIKFMQQFEKQH